jgi:peptidoglycan/xylan/chitin deacetylase (PgdA/CDA1 family)
MVKRIVKLFGSLCVRAWDIAAACCTKILGKTSPGRCVVLYYHEVPARDRQRFAQQLEMLALNATVLPADYTGDLETNQSFACVTFDDGFVSVLENALPELQRYKMPATIFVPSGYLGQQPGWIKKDKKEWVMTPEQLRAAEKGGLTIGSHTVKHPRLDKLSLEQASCEMAISKAELEKVLEHPVQTLSFPHGAYTAEVLQQAQKIGYRRVFGIKPKRIERSMNAFLVDRVAVNPSDWPIEFRLKIRGAYRWEPAVAELKSKIFRREHK